MISDFNCTIGGIKLNIPHKVWEGTTGLGEEGLPIFVVRAAHNKLRYFLTDSLQCYLYYLSPKFLIQDLGIIKLIALIAIILAIIKFFPKLKVTIIIAILIMPLIFFFQI